MLNTSMTYLIVSYAELFLMFLFYFILVVADFLVLVNSDAQSRLYKTGVYHIFSILFYYIYIFFIFT